MKISLMVLSAGKESGKALPINAAQFIIGRDPQCNLRPASAMIVKGSQVSLRDFESTNGTFVNDEQIKGEISLKDGDVLRVGPLSFKVVIEGLPAPSKPTPPPKPKGAESTDDDAAAALLSVDDEGAGASASTTETAEGHVPEGSTVMDMPAFVPTDADAVSEKKEEKPAEKKPVAKSPAKTGAAQDAAKAILEKMRAGRRK
jgi:predicted component of type VI protein secretion system